MNKMVMRKSNIPGEPGYYWCRVDTPGTSKIIVEVKKDVDGKLIYTTYSGYDFAYNPKDCFWSDKIEDGFEIPEKPRLGVYVYGDGKVGFTVDADVKSTTLNYRSLGSKAQRSVIWYD